MKPKGWPAFSWMVRVSNRANRDLPTDKWYTVIARDLQDAIAAVELEGQQEIWQIEKGVQVTLNLEESHD